MKTKKLSKKLLDNRLVAIFMGFLPPSNTEPITEICRFDMHDWAKTDYLITRDYELRHIQYDTNYSWLMAVVEKINTMLSMGERVCVNIDNNRILIQTNDYLPFSVVYKDKGITMKEGLFQAVVEFINRDNRAELTIKEKELLDERKFYLDLRNAPNKSSSEFQAQESSEKTIDKLSKEVAILRTVI